MEDIQSIILPDLSNKKTKPAKTPKTESVKTQDLKRVNRTIKCIYCQNDKILNPDQYQNLFNSLGSEEAVEKEFFCKQCEMEQKRNPYLFWTKYGESLHSLSKSIKLVVDAFANSPRNVENARNLQIGCLNVLKEHNVSPDNIMFQSDAMNVPTSLKIKNIPFVGEVEILFNEPRNSRILIRG